MPQLFPPQGPPPHQAEAEAEAEADPLPDAPETPTPPSFDVVRVEPDGGTLVAGRADPGVTVELRDPNTNALITSTTTDADGRYRFPALELGPGQSAVYAAGCVEKQLAGRAIQFGHVAAACAI